MIKKESYWKKLQERFLYSPLDQSIYQNAPSAIFRPLEHQKWKIIGKYLDFLNTDRIVKVNHNPIKEFVFRFSQNFGGVIGFFILLFLFLGALIIPLTTMDPLAINADARFKAMFQDGHIFGTDNFGRDVWAFMWHGLRYSLTLAMFVTFFELIIGIVLGTLMGKYHRFDQVMQFFIKVLNSVPIIIVLILISITIKPNFFNISAALILQSWTGLAQQIRAQVKKVKTIEWVSASRILGTPWYKILFNFMPTIVPMIIVSLVFSIPSFVLSETSLAFIGLSIPNIASLGRLLDNASRFFVAYPHLVILPAMLLILLATSLQLIGNSVQDSLRRQR